MSFKSIVNIVVILFVSINLSGGISSDSYEHKLRALILDKHDRVVRPEVKGISRTAVKVEFGLILNKLVKVSVKRETITVDTWIVMSWNNTFIGWDKKKYGKTERINFEPSEIWFPDIALINNADSSVHKAGGPDFFSSLVVVDNTGKNIWSGPATFTASCSMALSSWPFDDQLCNLTFGSITYGSHLLKIEKFQTKSDKGENFEESGNWHINKVVEVTLAEASFGNCCPYNFSQITYTIDMGRRFEYHLFYLVAPCSVLAFLTIFSFLIPPESGERIGFVTTLLLGMMVFLLIVPDSLPESSQSIPVLGLLMMCTMIVIGLALMATIFALRCYHAKGNPSRCFQCLMKPSKMNKTTPSESNRPKAFDTEIKLEEVTDNDSFGEQINRDESSVEDDNHWLPISEKIDQIFFWLFFLVVILMYGCTLGVSMSQTRNA